MASFKPSRQRCFLSLHDGYFDPAVAFNKWIGLDVDQGTGINRRAKQRPRAKKKGEKWYSAMLKILLIHRTWFNKR
jgi:hypothetical protein